MLSLRPSKKIKSHLPSRERHDAEFLDALYNDVIHIHQTSSPRPANNSSLHSVAMGQLTPATLPLVA